MTRLFNMSKAEAVPDAPIQWSDFLHFMRCNRFTYSLLYSMQLSLKVAIATTA